MTTPQEPIIMTTQQPHMKPDEGGTIRAGVRAPGQVSLSIQRYLEGAEEEVTLDPTEARLLGRWLIKLANQAQPKK